MDALRSQLESAAATAPVLWRLRLEGLAVAALATLLYFRTGASWWLFAVLWLLPDLRMTGYLSAPLWGARCYNTVHSYLLPAALAAAALLLHRDAALPLALIRFHHIGVDRLLGHGLKYRFGFGSTHLANLSRQSK